MRVFDRIDPATLERRDWQLWMLALVTIFVLALGLAVLMYPTVFSNSSTLTATLHRSFFGFCALSLLLVFYLVDRQLVIRQLRGQLAEEQRLKVSLLEQASEDLLGSLPGFSYFQDRLAMEFRRVAHAGQALSVLVVRVQPSREAVQAAAAATALGDAAKVLIRRLRREDSIYLFWTGVFGILLPGVRGTDANRVVERIYDGLMDASGAGNRFTSDVRMINYPEHTATAHELEHMAVATFPESRPQPRAA
jgi:GGDEF domain-containing protein